MKEYNYMKMLCSKLSRNQIIEDLAIKCEELYLARESILKKDKEIKRLNNIRNEAINYTTKQMKKYEGYDRDFEIVLSNIVVMLGSDKE